MKYLHTMVRVNDLDASLDFYCNKLGLVEVRRKDHEQGRFTLVFLSAPGDLKAQLELTWNWEPEAYAGGRNFGHLAYEVADIYCTVPTTVGRRGRYPPPTPGWSYGLCALARRHFGRVAAARRPTGTV
jgi:lactoylglutathione lyase